MPAGIQLYGSHGVLQIDELFSNLALRASGTFSGQNTLSVANSTTPILACRTTDANGTFSVWRTVSGGTTTFGFRNNVPSGNWWIFDVPIALSHAGIQVFNAGGALVFDSDREYMKVVGNYDLGSSTPSEPAGKTYAWVQTGSGFSEALGSPGTVNQFGYAVKMNASKQIVPGPSYQLGGRSGSTASSTVKAPAILLLDVTGM